MIDSISHLHPVAQVAAILGIAVFSCITVYYFLKLLNEK